MSTDAISLLPSLGQATETLLADYAAPLLARLRRLKGGAIAVVTLDEAVRELRSAFYARELCTRLTTAADELAAQAELDVEARLREFFAACGAGSRLQRLLFAEGLGSALAPRGQAQVAEAARLLRDLARYQKRGEPRVNAAALRMATAALELAERCAASARAQASLVDAITAEHQQQRAFRQTCHDAQGIVLSLHPTRSAGRQQYFKASRSGPTGLPAAPPHPKAARRATKARSGRGREGA